MQRILIIGNAGAGKSTFARLLAKKLQLPLVHLDKLYWQGTWEHLSREEFDVHLQQKQAEPCDKSSSCFQPSGVHYQLIILNIQNISDIYFVPLVKYYTFTGVNRPPA